MRNAGNISVIGAAGSSTPPTLTNTSIPLASGASVNSLTHTTSMTSGNQLKDSSFSDGPSDEGEARVHYYDVHMDRDYTFIK